MKLPVSSTRSLRGPRRHLTEACLRHPRSSMVYPRNISYHKVRLSTLSLKQHRIAFRTRTLRARPVPRMVHHRQALLTLSRCLLRTEVVRPVQRRRSAQSWKTRRVRQMARTRDRDTRTIRPRVRQASRQEHRLPTQHCRQPRPPRESERRGRRPRHPSVTASGRMTTLAPVLRRKSQMKSRVHG